MCLCTHGTEIHSTETKNASLKTSWTVGQKLDLKHDSYCVLICLTDGGDVSVVHSHTMSCLLMQENNLAQQLKTYFVWIFWVSTYRAEV